MEELVRNRDKLVALYRETSKHSNYQILANTLKTLIGHQQINVVSRHERERLKYILRNLSIQGKNILDIGGNTGFFTFEALNHGALTVSYYEGNKVHAEFVKEASSKLNIENKILIHNEYYLFDESSEDKYDVILLLNVLHHVGDDYSDNNVSIESALSSIVQSLQSLAFKTEFLVFQMGFNWKGDIRLPFFSGGTKQEVIEFVQGAVKNCFEVLSIGVGGKVREGVVYNVLNDTNINRDDELGEFLNRPIFIMKSKLFQ